MGSPAFGFPPLEDTVAWARMLAAAQSMDKMQAGDSMEYEDPQTMARLDMLLPIALKLYDEKIRAAAEIESRKIDFIIVRCAWLARAGGSSQQERGAMEQWDEETCRREAANLIFWRESQPVQPLSPDLIGLLLLPQTFAWRRLREAIIPNLSMADEEQSALYLSQINIDIGAGLLDQDKQRRMQPLRNVRFVDEVRRRAAPLVGALPPQWASPDISDALLEALLGLLNLGNTRPLANLVHELSNAEYGRLVKERSCLLQVLDKGRWKRDCADGRRLYDYNHFVRALRQVADFEGALAEIPSKSQPINKPHRQGVASRLPVPVLRGRPIAGSAGSECAVSDTGSPAARCNARTLTLDKKAGGMAVRRKWRRLQYPSQTNIAAWARMLAAARDADEIETAGSHKVSANPLSKTRQGRLLALAGELYDQRVRRIAANESCHIDTMRGHCHQLAPTMYLPEESPSTDCKRGAEVPWDRETCDDEAHTLRVPLTHKSLQPVSPDVIGLLLIPYVSVWRQVRTLISIRLSKAERDQKRTYNNHIYDSIRRNHRKWSDVQLLNDVLLVDEVRVRAPPLVGALPPQWTSPDISDELLEALQALLKLSRTRALANLVDMLSNDEYEFLVREHWCLSQVLDQGDWPDDCAKERSLGDYKEFVRILRLESGFKGLPKTVPVRSKKAAAFRRKAKDASGDVPAPLAHAHDSVEASRSTQRLAMVPSGSDALAGWTVKRQRSDMGRGRTGKRQRSAADPLMLLAQAATDVEGSAAAPRADSVLARSQGAVAVSSVSASLLATAGVVMALGLVLLLAVLVVRLQSRRAARGRSRAL